MSVPPVVVIVGTGGTVAARSSPDGLIPAAGLDEIIADAVALRRGPAATIRARALMSVDSSTMTDATSAVIVDAVAASLLDPDVVGVVVLHGTDTLEETAMAVDLVHADPRPVVFTGAQVPADSPDADGPGNLADAIAHVTRPDARGAGVLVCFGGSVLPARATTKSHTVERVAFTCAHPGLPRPLLAASAVLSPRVDIVATWPGMPGDVVAASIDAGARGLVIAAFGSANVPPQLADAVVDAIAAGVVVVMTSRVPGGAVTAAYGGDGGGVRLVRSGAIVSRWLRASQARVALVALLGRGATRADVAEFFALSDPTTVASPSTPD